MPASTKNADRRRAARDVTLRAIAAVPLNYVVSTLITVMIARILPGGAAQGSVGSMLLSFAIFAGIAMTCFAVASTARLWLWLVGAALLLGAADWALIAQGGRL
jgi:hypothetical protein